MYTDTHQHMQACLTLVLSIKTSFKIRRFVM